MTTETTTVYAIVSRYGRTDVADDREVVIYSDRYGRPHPSTTGERYKTLKDGSIAVWALNENTRQVIYFENLDDAEAIAKYLGPYRPGATCGTCRHDRDASYVEIVKGDQEN